MSMTATKVNIFVSGSLFIIGIIIGILLNNKPPKEIIKTEKKIEYRDTLIRYVKDYSKTIDYSKNIIPSLPQYVFVTDTVMRDSVVYVRDTAVTYTFKERDYNVEISAVKLYNYSIELHPEIPVQIQTETITNTVYRNKRFTHGIQIGVGAQYNLITNKVGVGPYIGYGLTWNF